MHKLALKFFTFLLMAIAVNLPNFCFAREGTSNGGGGNGLNGKLLESYIIDPISLPAFQNKIAPILNKISGMKPEWKTLFEKFLKDPKKFDFPVEKIGARNLQPFFRAMAFYGLLLATLTRKTFYIAPVDLKEIPNAHLGIPFVTNQAEQIALQTESEIWIDSRKFAAFSESEQAELIMHEMVMSLYWLNLQSDIEICAIMAGNASGACPEKVKPFFLGEEAPQTNRESSLQPGDLPKIRALTRWLLDSGASSTTEAFISQMQRFGFSRVLGLHLIIHAILSMDHETASMKKVYDGLRIAKLTRAMEFTCGSAPCTLDFSLAKAKKNRILFESLSLAGASVLNFGQRQILLEDLEQPFFFDVAPQQKIVAIPLRPLGLKQVEGTLFSAVSLLLAKSTNTANEELQVVGALITPKVVINASTGPARECEARRVENEPQILALSKSKPISPHILRVLRLEIPAKTSCY